jgi:hypothetical protein
MRQRLTQTPKGGRSFRRWRNSCHKCAYSIHEYYISVPFEIVGIDYKRTQGWINVGGSIPAQQACGKVDARFEQNYKVKITLIL